MLEEIKIVLVETSHPGNIGAVARAMKNMGLKRLVLVNPKAFPSAIATERAAGADDILEHAEVVPELSQAIEDCEMVFGTSARSRQITWPTVDAKQMADKIVQYPESNKVAVVFGTERSGLTNEALANCHYHVVIPANPEYSSLNLSQAVQVLSYEIYQSFLSKQESNPIESLPPQAPMSDVLGVFEHLEKVLGEVGFLAPKPSRTLIYRLKRLLIKARLDKEEVNILRGIFKTVQRRISEQISSS